MKRGILAMILVLVLLITGISGCPFEAVTYTAQLKECFVYPAGMEDMSSGMGKLCRSDDDCNTALEFMTRMGINTAEQQEQIDELNLQVKCSETSFVTTQKLDGSGDMICSTDNDCHSQFGLDDPPPTFDANILADIKEVIKCGNDGLCKTTEGLSATRNSFMKAEVRAVPQSEIDQI